jgi:hypothetical protein
LSGIAAVVTWTSGAGAGPCATDQDAAMPKIAHDRSAVRADRKKTFPSGFAPIAGSRVR